MNANWLLSADEMRRAESAAFATGLSSFVTMQRAGHAVAEVIMAHWPRRRVDQVLVLCGPGNNGGDGFIAAARLRDSGWPVVVACVTSTDRLMGDAARAARQWGSAPQIASPALAKELGPKSIVVDALFGIGLARDLRDSIKDLVNAVNECRADVISVDMPSGIDSDGGRVMGAAIRATMTVTFGWPKRGQLLLPGSAHVGRLLIASVGLDTAKSLSIDPVCRVNAPQEWIDDYRISDSTDNKYRRGHVLVVAGPLAGAARLAAAGARGVGSGMVSVADATGVLRGSGIVEAGVVLRRVDGATGVGQLLGERNVSAAVVGSGFMGEMGERDQVVSALAAAKPIVVDGGGLSAFAGDPPQLFKAIRASVVLTPHEGEFSKLFPDITAGSKIDRALAAARRSGAVMVLKGSDTVIAAPDGKAYVGEGAPASLATAGSGDVLAGAVAGLLGLGMSPMAASGMAVWLHAAAARTSRQVLLAEDLAGVLPMALQETLIGRRSYTK